MKSIRKFFQKRKVSAKKLLTIILLTIAEIVIILWFNDWNVSPYLIAPFIQFVMILEKKDVWDKLTEKEKKEVMLDEDDVTGLIKGIERLIEEGKTSEEILDEIKIVKN